MARRFLFSYLKLAGHWRHDDSWQILPCPADAPQLSTELGSHPFVLEYRYAQSPDGLIRQLRAQRRLWELHKLLSLVLQAGCEAPAAIAQQASHIDLESLETRYGSIGYVAPGFVVEADGLSPMNNAPPATVVDDDEYLARSGVAADDSPLQIPRCLGELASLLDTAPPAIKTRFLQSCFWQDRARASWPVSFSLTHLSYVTALESLTDDNNPPPDHCPTCARDRTSINQRVARLVADLAPEEAATDLRRIYGLRSSIVHGNGLLAVDKPRSLEPLLSPLAGKAR